MNNWRKQFERFCLRNRDRGIPNLMLYIALGSGLVYLLSQINDGSALYMWLCFDKAAILRGQIWRLFTYVFTYTPGSDPFLILIGLYFFYHIGRNVELRMGTFRFNLYYFTGMFLMATFAMIFCPTEAVVINSYVLPPEYFTYLVYSDMAWFLHLSLVLIYCVAYPDSQFLVFFIIPVKAWFLSLIYLIMTVISIYNMTVPVSLFPHNLFPLVGLANFLLFAGKDVLNLLPTAIRPNPHRPRKPSAYQPQPKRTGTIPFSPTGKAPKAAESGAYTHRCTVCGRTDVSNPELEFRYCSRCSGYHCYCQEHIDSHTHINT
ncbi:MAG: rhomboid family intramembrane serine protease [Oscillospiraceae bacterium]|nr:rhomboid family intramembrane serine protease [Oscillospiraceae bacterium]